MEQPTAPAAQPAPSPVGGVNQNYAGFWIRFGAILIDGIIASVIQTVLYIPVFFMDPEGTAGVIIASVSSLAALAWMIYNQFYLLKKNGASIGKKVLKIQVISLEGDLSWGKVLLREVVGKFVSGFIFNIGYIMAGFTEKKQGVHDMIAKTVVIKKG